MHVRIWSEKQIDLTLYYNNMLTFNIFCFLTKFGLHDVVGFSPKIDTIVIV